MSREKQYNRRQVSGVALAALSSFLLLFTSDEQMAFSSLAPVPDMPPDTTLHIAKTSQQTNTFTLGMSDVDTNLIYPQSSEQASQIKHLLAQSSSLTNIHIIGWGADDPWPDPAQPEPTNWSTLDKKLQIALDTGTTPVITLCEAPWWMKGRLNADGSTTRLTRNDDFADITYDARILDNHMSDWLHLVQRIAERYMAPPYNVRYFQVWNELKGYYNPIINNWDGGNSQGDPTEDNARHGYTYMYNQVYTTLKQVAQGQGIDPPQVKVGGPYVVMDSWASTNAPDRSNVKDQYGALDRRSLKVVTTWLSERIGGDFITIDGGNINKDQVNLTDPFTATEKFADAVRWIRSLDPHTYPGATTLPIWWAEWYAIPFATENNPDYNNALKTYTLLQFINSGTSVALAWGYDGLWNADPGTPGPWYWSAKAIKEHFPVGTPLYETSSTSQDIVALASKSSVLLINKSLLPHVVDVEGKHIPLRSFQVVVISR